VCGSEQHLASSCTKKANIQPIVGKAVPAHLTVFDVARFDNSVGQ